MSETVDNRVLEMRFDNKQFERDVATSMSTLDKLKQKLNLSGASKGLENVSSAAKNFKMDGVGAAVETVRTKFSALEVMGVTALANITNSAVNTGRRIASALTIDPVKTGLQEYETQINAVQTILANTQHQGTNIDQVNAALDELNKYADLTIYNFTEMTRNIGTFTAAGIDLDTSVSAIQGIANLAAVSGSTSQQASTAMYQLSQALATGTVKLMDWNSVVNAGMGGKVFQDALTETSEKLGTGAKNAIKAAGSFRESLQKGWLTSEVLTETLKKFTTSGANEYVAKYTGLSKEAVEAAVKHAKAAGDEATAIDRAAEALAKKSGKSKDEIKSALQMADTAEQAATKVKTFTQLWDVLKEAAQSGWSQTWRLVIGDFEEAKALFTPLSEFLTGIIGKMSDARNTVLEGALGSPFGKLIKEVSDFTKTTKETVKTVKDLGNTVDKVIHGDFGNGAERYKKLSEAGYNWMEVQNKVNEKLGNSHRYTQKEIEAQDKLLGTQKRVVDGQEKTLDQLARLSDAKLKSIGYTDEQVRALRELEKQADKSGMSMTEFVKNYNQMDGRTMLIESLKNAGQGLVTVCNAISKAWRQAFWGDASEKDILQKKAEGIYGFIESLYSFSRSLKMSRETSDLITRSFRGLFSVLSLISKISSGGLKIAFGILKQVLAAFDTNLLEVTAHIGDVVYNFNRWIETNGIVTTGVKLVTSVIVKMAKGIAKLIDSFNELPFVQEVVERFGRVFNDVQGAFSNFTRHIKSLSFDDIVHGLTAIKESVQSAFSDLFDGISDNMFSGFIGSIRDKTGGVVKAVIDIGVKILEAIKTVLGIHSPSTEMRAIGENAIEGLYNGLKAGAAKVIEVVKDIADNILNVLGKIDWGKVSAAGALIGFIAIGKKFSDAFSAIASPFAGLGSLLSNAGEVLDKSAKSISKVIGNFAKIEKSFSKVLNGFAFEKKAQGIKTLAISIVIIATAVAVLSFIDTEKLWNTVGVIAALAAILVALAFATEKMSKASLLINKNGVSAKNLSSGLIGIAGALLMLAYTVKIIGSLNPDRAKQGFIGLAGLVTAVALVFLAFGTLVKGKSAQNVDKAGAMLLKMSFAMLMLVTVTKLAGNLSPEEMLKGAAFAAAFVGFVELLIAAARFAGKKIDQIGGMILKLSVSMLVLVSVVKLAGSLSADEMAKGAAFVAGFLIFVGALVAISRVAGTGPTAKLGGLLLSISVSMMLMIGVMKLVNQLTVGDAVKGAMFAAAFVVFLKALTKVTTIKSGEQTAKMASTLLAVSVAIGVLAGICVLLGMVDTASLVKGVAAVGALGALMIGMIKATQNAQDCKGNLIAMSVVIAVMAASVAALSFIKPTKLAGATAAMSVLMLVFGLMVKLAGTAQMAIGPLIVMGVVVALFGATLYLLAELPISSTLGVAAALSAMLLAMAATFVILGTFGALAPTAMIGALGMMGVVAIVGGLALAIGALMSLLPKDMIKEWETGLSNFMDFIVILAGGLGEALGAFISGALGGIISTLPTLGANLSLFMANLTPFLVGIKMIDASMLKGVGVLAATILALTAVDLINGVTSLLPFVPSLADLGLQLTGFMVNLLPFLSVLHTVKPSAIVAGESLAKMILALSAAELLDGISKIIGLGSGSFEKLGERIIPFGKAVCDFSNTIMSNGGINEKTVSAAANAGKILTEVQKTIPRSGGFLQDAIGEKDWEKFNEGIKSFGDAIVAFNAALGDKGINEAAITTATNAGKALTEVQKAIPKSDGFLQGIIGEKDWEKFNEGVKAFGVAIVAFNKSIVGENAIDESAIDAATNAGRALTELQAAIPEEHWLDGKVSLDEFGDKIKAFGKGIKEYSEEIKDIDTENVASSITFADQLVTLAKRLIDLDPDAGNNFKVQQIGEAMKNYSDKVDEIDTECVTASVAAALKLVSLIGRLKSLDTSGIANFKVVEIGNAMKSYSNAMSGLNAQEVTSSISSAMKLVVLIRSLADLDTSGIGSFKSAVESLGKIDFGLLTKKLDGSAGQFTSVGRKIAESIVVGFKAKRSALILVVSAMTKSALDVFTTRTSEFRKAGEALMLRLVAGIAAQRFKVLMTAASVMATAINAIRNNHSGFYSAGGYLGNGLVGGIASKKTAAYNAGYALGKAAVQGEKDGQESHSPSKLTIQAGKWLGEGLIIGINKMDAKAYGAGHSLGERAARSMSDAISKVSSFIDSGMDVQPTIRPVVDLSDVRTGVGMIGHMFDTDPLLDARTNAGSIMTMTNRRLQNGQNGEVVSAIDKLRRDLGNIGRPSYNINGVTYTESSDVEEALRTIIRAAGVERRN